MKNAGAVLHEELSEAEFPRREWDSNPRNRLTRLNRFQDCRLRPLGHPSMCAPRPRTVNTQSSSSPRLQTSDPRTPEKRRLGLLPFGPDPVHETLAVWDPAFNAAFPLLSEQRTPSGGGSAPREEGFGYRAPLAPRSAHGEIVASTPVGERGKPITMSGHPEGSHSPA